VIGRGLVLFSLLLVGAIRIGLIVGGSKPDNHIMSHKMTTTGSMTGASDWIDVERKNMDPTAERRVAVTVMTGKGGKGGKGKKGKMIKLRLPASVLPELKRHYAAAGWDAETLDIPTATASSYNFFTQIGIGTANDSRLGDAIFVERVVIRLYIAQSASATSSVANLALVQDLEPAAGAPAWTDMFQGVGGAGPAAYHVAIPNYDKRYRFKYLERAVIPLHWSAAYYASPSTFVSPGTTTLHFEVPIKRKVYYDNTNGRPVRGNELMLWGWSDTNTNTPQATMSYEIFFTDA